MPGDCLSAGPTANHQLQVANDVANLHALVFSISVGTHQRSEDEFIELPVKNIHSGSMYVHLPSPQPFTYTPTARANHRGLDKPHQGR